MRIIAGKYKGRSLCTPKNQCTRPTSSKLRETIFNIIQDKVVGSLFLELFAGSGAISLEALSRDAEKVYLIENNLNAFQCIKKNVETFEVQEKIQIFFMDVFKGLSLIGKQKIQFDLIYADPPYSKSGQENFLSIETLSAIDKFKLLKRGGLCFLEEGIEFSSELLSFNTLKLKRIKKQGSIFIYEFEGI